MTEDEAKTKWCPMVRFVSTGDRAYNNRPSCNGHTLCIASACMAWRWVSIVETQGQRIPMPKANPDGYCGLAGEPA